MIAWLNEHCYPHVSVITDCTKAELLEGVNSFNTDDYIRDYMVDEGTSPEAMLILEEDEPETKWCKIHNEPYLYGCHRCHNDGIGA